MIFENITKYLIAATVISIGGSAARDTEETEMTHRSSNTYYGATGTSNNYNQYNHNDGVLSPIHEAKLDDSQGIKQNPQTKEDFKKQRDEIMNAMRRDAQAALEIRAVAVKEELDLKTKELYRTNSLKGGSDLITGKKQLELEVEELTKKYKTLEVYLHAKEDAESSWPCCNG